MRSITAVDAEAWESATESSFVRKSWGIPDQEASQEESRGRISSAPASLVTSIKDRARKLSREQDAATNRKQRTFFALPLAM